MTVFAMEACGSIEDINSTTGTLSDLVVLRIINIRDAAIRHAMTVARQRLEYTRLTNELFTVIAKRIPQNIFISFTKCTNLQKYDMTVARQPFIIGINGWCL